MFNFNFFNLTSTKNLFSNRVKTTKILEVIMHHNGVKKTDVAIKEVWGFKATLLGHSKSFLIGSKSVLLLMCRLVEKN